MTSPAAAVPHPYARPPRDHAVPLVAPRELARLLDSAERPFLVDVRRPEERRLVRLPDDRAIPLAELAASIHQLPRDRAIVLYDHLGFQARVAAEFLLARGWKHVAALEGGIDEYARVVAPELGRYPAEMPTPDLLLRQLPRPETGCLAYFVGDPNSRHAIIVDPGVDPEPYRNLLKEGNWTLAAIVESHTHADHLAGHSALHAATDAPIFLSHRSPASYPHRNLSEGEAVSFGSSELVAIETPGHTPDHLTLKVRDKIFTGDTLLLGSVGRTDLGPGSPDALYESLTDKLLRLPAETEVYPAHYGPLHALPQRYVSTLGFERATNEALNQGSREKFIQYMTEGWPPKPADFERIVRANLEG
jgi:glyoxylase-like metal-dependent hydrolase (beta-lactamase superfamily II)/rhodanese-related sulfurtransferase